MPIELIFIDFRAALATPTHPVEEIFLSVGRSRLSLLVVTCRACLFSRHCGWFLMITHLMHDDLLEYLKSLVTLHLSRNSLDYVLDTAGRKLS